MNAIEDDGDGGCVAEADSLSELPIESKASDEYEPEYALNVCLKSGKEYEVLLPSRESADKLLEEVAKQLGF